MKTIINGIEIKAISSWLPTSILDIKSLSTEYGSKIIDNIIKVSGIERVHIAKDWETSSDLCFNAAVHLIEKEHLDRKEIDGLVFVSQTTDYILPSTSIILQNRLGLTKDTVCIDIHYGCTGYIYGLLQAATWIVSKLCNNVLVLSGDTTSRIINDKDKSLRTIFGDCGTATLVSKGLDSIAFSVNSDGSGYDKLIIPAGGFRIPRSKETSIVTYDENNNGHSQNDLYMDGMAIFNFVMKNVPKDITDTLSLMNWDKDEIDLFALHQANAFILKQVRRKLQVPIEKVPINVKEFGNTSQATIPLLLSDIGENFHGHLSKVILSGFGVGLSWGSIACNMNRTHFYEPINKI